MKKNFYRILLAALAIIFLLSGWKLVSYYRDGRRTQNRYDELAAMVQQTQPPENTTAATEPSSTQADVPEVTTEPQPDDGILPEYRELLAYNPDLVGWLVIEGTEINYPVVQTPDQPEYYIDRDFDGELNEHGCLFADGNCDVENSDNVTIYGHHMNDGTMFGSLLQYDKHEYWKAHPVILFDTLTEHRRYEIFAVFRTTASIGQGFPYHRFIDAATEEEFDQFVAQCKALSVYETGIEPEFGEQLISLSTCEYSQHNGRYVVVGVYRHE